MSYRLGTPVSVLLAMRPLLMLLAATGCGPATDHRDERLAEFAQQTMKEQRLQNTRMADQAQAIVAESQQLAGAAKELIAHDAEARRALLASHNELSRQLDQQRATINASRDQLEQDRREIAEQRTREPIIAAAIANTGLLLACLLPLLLAGLIVLHLRSQEPDHAAVVELLVSELTSDRPRFLLAAAAPRSPHGLGYHDPNANQPEPDDDAYPF